MGLFGNSSKPSDQVSGHSNGNVIDRRSTAAGKHSSVELTPNTDAVRLGTPGYEGKHRAE